METTDTDKRLRALMIGGRLLQSRWQSPGRARRRIELAPGERYPEAVRRTILALSEEEREELRGLVLWVLEYEGDSADGASPSPRCRADKEKGV